MVQHARIDLDVADIVYYTGVNKTADPDVNVDVAEAKEIYTVSDCPRAGRARGHVLAGSPSGMPPSPRVHLPCISRASRVHLAGGQALRQGSAVR